MVRFLFMDIDGTLTDGKIYVGNSGELIKAFSVKDGYAIGQILPQYNISPVVITGRNSEIVSNRCRELGIKEIYQNVRNKKEKMISVAEEHGINISEAGILPYTAYIGDDIPDLDCMMLAERKGCPADAAEKIKTISDFVSVNNGGDGAVREFVEWLIQ